MTRIGDSAFGYCENLTSISLPSSVKRIESCAFVFCTGLTDIYLPDDITVIENDAFNYCISLTNVILPKNLVTIGDSAFNECFALTGINIPEKVTNIGRSAFFSCENLISIFIPANVKSIGEHAFNRCKGLTELIISEGVTSIGYGAFLFCNNLTSITIPKGITDFGEAVFSRCEKLSNVVFTEGIESIPSNTFLYCPSLKSITLPGSVTSIGWGAFCGCTSLLSVIIPSNVTSIGEGAFTGCTSLTDITVKPETPPIAEGKMFEDTNNTPIYVPAGSVDAYKSADGWSEYADRIQAIPSSSLPIPEAIDLGLSVKWASFNLGATKPEEYGDYYAWGETEPYYSSLNPLTWKEGKNAGYDWASYKWCKGSNTTLTKYCNNAEFGYGGYTDDNLRLNPEDDAATANWGGEWRMPALEELEELDDKCTWEWTTQNGVNGYKITGPNSNSIFLPANGGFWESIRFSGEMCMYWSSSLYLFWGTDPDFAHVIFGNESYHDFDDDDGENELGRFRGYAIRPVYGPQTIKYDVESLSLNKTKLELPVGETATLVATAFPEGAVNGSEYSLMWSSSDKNIATVSWLGVVKGVGVGTAIITAMSPEGKKATCEVTVQPSVAVPEAVDLGLSVKWASFNLGASKPEECGDYYAWGETEPYYSSLDPLTWKDNRGMGYDWMSYKWCVGSSDTIVKYTDSDGNTVLEPADDAAHVNLGKGWRMPTKAEQVKLKNNCTWEWISNNGVDGYMVSGPNGNSIFLPVTGWRGGEDFWLPTYGIYWSSSLEQQRPYRAYGLYFLTDQVSTRGYDRYYGQTIRPVCE